MPNLSFISNIRIATSEKPEDAKTPQSDVQYTNLSPDPTKTCSGCANFISPTRCKTVKGPIDPAGWCIRYKET